MSVALRVVECEGGPQDGASLAVHGSVELPETISFPASDGGKVRHVYNRQAEAENLVLYRYSHFEVRP